MPHTLYMPWITFEVPSRGHKVVQKDAITIIRKHCYVNILMKWAASRRRTKAKCHRQIVKRAGMCARGWAI